MATLSELTLPLQILSARLANNEMSLAELQEEMSAISMMIKSIDSHEQQTESDNLTIKASLNPPAIFTHGIEWNESYELGINQIDEHHSILVGILNKTYYCCFDVNCDESLVNLLEQLSSYVRYHFSVEEQFMKIYDFPEQLVQIHTAEHNLFTRQIVKFQEDLLDGNGLLAMEMVKFLTNWLVSHILEVDKQLCDYLITKGATMHEITA